MYALNGNYVPGALLNSLNILLYLILTILRGYRTEAGTKLSVGSERSVAHPQSHTWGGQS